MHRALTVLVVDDEEAARTFLKTALEALGYDSFEAGSGEQALSLLRAGRVTRTPSCSTRACPAWVAWRSWHN